MMRPHEGLANPLAGPNARAPQMPQVGPGKVIAPGKPLQVQWTPKSALKPVTAPQWAGRLVSGPTDTLVAVSPDGDAVALGNDKGRYRVIQLLTGRVSPFISAAKAQDWRLAVSGFAALYRRGRRVERIHTWTGRKRGQATLPIGYQSWAVDAALHTVVTASVRAKKICLTRTDLFEDQGQHCVGWQHGGRVEQVSVDDRGQSAWLIISAGATAGSAAHWVMLWDIASLKPIHRWALPTSKGSVRAQVQAGVDQLHVGSDATETWSLERVGNQVVTRKWALAGRLRLIRATQKALQLHRGCSIVRDGQTGAVLDAMVLPGPVKSCTLAEDGAHIVCLYQGRLDVFDSMSGRQVLKRSEIIFAQASRSRLLWRDSNNKLRTATWMQLQSPKTGHSIGLSGALWRVQFVVQSLR
ncbi:MAG: hypothetical protein CMH53_08050 [Myxococcales bacterium]|nr:hypothetical protein [Myxococcales bacterium]